MVLSEVSRLRPGAQRSEAADLGFAPVTNRYAWYEQLRELGDRAELEAAYELAAALHELARLVLSEQEQQAAEMLAAVPSRR